MAKKIQPVLNPAVTAYIEKFAEPTKGHLKKMREILLKTLPMAEEVISYGMPAYKHHTVLVYFAGYAKHIGFYPTGTGIARFQKEIAVYQHSKGAVQFPLTKALPVPLIKQISLFKLEEAESLQKEKNKKVCPKGHVFYKSSTCLTCPVCEKAKKEEQPLFDGLSAPARRALETKGITSLQALSKFTEKEILSLHGIGPSAIPVLKKHLSLKKLRFTKSS